MSHFIKSLFFYGILFHGTVILYADGAFVDNISKCKLADGHCAAQLLQSTLHDIAKTGIPELGIPPVDPIKLSNLSVTVLDGIQITLVQGQMKGIKDCKIDNFQTIIEAKKAILELSCDLLIKGQYKVSSSNSMIKNILGGDVHGEGNIKCKIDQLFLRGEFNFVLERKQDGGIYFVSKAKDVKYKHDVKGNMNLFVDNFYLGNQESSEVINNLFNQNWRSLMPTFGEPFFDKGMDIMTKFLHKFYDVVPGKYFFIEDLSPYVEKDS